MGWISDDLHKNNEIVGKYGIKFLDDYLLGIKRSDFVKYAKNTDKKMTKIYIFFSKHPLETI